MLHLMPSINRNIELTDYQLAELFGWASFNASTPSQSNWFMVCKGLSFPLLVCSTNFFNILLQNPDNKRTEYSETWSQLTFKPSSKQASMYGFEATYIYTQFAVDEPYEHMLARLWMSDCYETAHCVDHSVLPYCLVRTGIGGVVAPSPRCERAASHT